MAEAKPIIELEDISVTYQSHVALNNINLGVPAGSFLAVVGPNGSGKTTLLKTILGTIRPSRGTVRVFGRPPWDLGEERRRIGYVPQAMSVDLRFPIRAGEVVLMGRYGRIGLMRRPSSTDREAALQAMQRVGITDLANEPIGRLSGGQRQRVFVARALANDPDLLLLDEPTTGVDIATSGSFYDLLYKLHKEGLTVVVVSHDMGVVANYADTVACINQCMVVHGRPGEVATGEVLACMYGPRAAFLDHGPIPHMVVPEHETLDTEKDKNE
ncbi:MAG: ATP-binding cassette domain-containing protein [Armatimonadetes bacterium]|nr:ATP-binding cassette domain-containing protein [Armatimonadota bacterium]NIM23178.1 ATP-binding cassette domain-containing protein [Armatimonadota bacterium]NIM67046.1 ATP-binding cassette domain-containing protein [Armatimonadota bacterium]NIM75580.1 ATP-binding cassette domain-containing protein [Armatimonadota bacterium]NIN05235.1 ATP-binding cassette domain-containing protein [Armatimonadota bacterium]